MHDDGRIICLPRISAANFEAFRRLMKNEIAPSLEEWTKRHKESVSYWGDGSRIVEIDVDPDEFASFCHRKSRGYDGKALHDFAAELGEIKG